MNNAVQKKYKKKKKKKTILFEAFLINTRKIKIK